MAVKLEKYVDDDLITTALLFAGYTQADIQTRLGRSGNIRAVLDTLASSNDDATRKKAGLVTGYLNNLGTDHLTKLLTDGAGIDKADAESAVYNAQQETGGTATPTLDRVLYHLGGATGRTKTQAAVDFAATVRPALQTLGRGDTGLMTTRTQYREGQRSTGTPPAPASMGPAPSGSAGPRAGSGPMARYDAPAAPASTAMGTTKSRATPGVKSPEVMQQPAPGPGATPAGGGGPNNKVTVDNPANWDDEKVRTWIKQNLGSDAWFIDIPAVWTAMKDAVKAGKGITGADEAFKASAFYQQSSSKARLWYQYEREDPPSAARDVAQQTQAIQKLARDAGIDIDPTRAQQMAQSYLRYGWSQADLQQAIGAEWHYDPSTKNQAAAVTKMKADAQNWLVPLSDSAIQTWGQGLISGTVTQDQYTQYLRDNAKSLMPQLANLIDQHAGDPNFSVSTFADPYKQHAANLLGLQPDQINLNDSKWRQALDTVDSKTGERRIMSLSEWESKIKTDKSFGYDNTANGINDGLQLASALKQSMGF